MLRNTSVDDLRATLKCSRGKFSLKELYDNLEAEYKQETIRVSVVRLFQSEIKLAWRKLKGKALFDHYPKVDVGTRGAELRYVRYPKQMEDGKWHAVNVLLPTGYQKLATARQFDDLRDCQTACNVENILVGFSPKQAKEIIAESFKNA